MPGATTPEIKRVNLTSSVLTLKSMGIDDILGFDFLDRPDTDQLKHALKHLFLLDALDKDGRLRKLGEELSKFPVEPTYAKALLAACFVSKQCEEDFIKLLSILSTESIWMGVSR